MKKLFHGKETFLSFQNAKKYVLEIRETISNIEYQTVDVPTQTSETIIRYLSTSSIFDTPKIYFFKRLYENKEKEKIIEYILTQKELSPNNHYIFWEEQKIPSNTKYFKYFNKDVEEQNPLNKPSFYALAKEILTQNSIKFDTPSVQYLCQRVNFDPERLIKAIEKLSLEGITQITADSIKEKTTDTLEQTIWDLTKYLNESNKVQVFKTYENLKKHTTDANFIISMIARNLRLLTLVKYCEENNLDNRSICSKLRIPPFTLPELSRASRSLDKTKIKYFYEKLSSLDFEIKRGNIDPDTGIILLLSKL